MVDKQKIDKSMHGKALLSDDTHQHSQSEDAALVASLKDCAKTKDLYGGFNLHAGILRCGLLGKSSYVANTLVSMYAKCGALARARHILGELPLRNVVSWSALISGYAQQGCSEEALKCFELMQHEGLCPNAVTFIGVLKACGSIGAVDKGDCFHEEIVRQGLLGKDIVLGNALVDMYAKCGALAKAQRILEELPIRDVVSWSSIIAGYSQQGQGQCALDCFERMQSEGLAPDVVTFASILKACGSLGAFDKGEEIHEEIARQGLLETSIMLGNALVDMYTKCGALAKAKQVLEKLPLRDVVSWSALIAGYAQQGQGQDALNCYEKMQHEGISPNIVTVVCVLKACGSIGAIDMGEQIHDDIIKQGWLGANVVLGCALVDMYAKCGALAKAQQVLEEFLIHDVVLWNALIAGYVQQGQAEKALQCFDLMQGMGLSPNEVTFSSILKACGIVRAVDRGVQIHDEIAREGFLENNIVLSTALVDMYAKCGALAKAHKLHDELPGRNVVSWSALIAGYVEQGHGQDALECFEQMRHEGLCPDAVTFGCVLKACSSIGALDKGEQIHNEIAKHGLLGKNIALGNALIDMYAKCGALDKAKQVLEELPFLDAVSWSALISGYVQHGQSEEAMCCFDLMQHKGFSPDEVTFSCILKACGNMGAADKGKQIHDEIARQGLLGKDVVLGTALVDMYAKCGALGKAQEVLEDLPVQNAASWNALIAGYTQKGQAEQALNCFERMKCKGLSSDSVTFLCILKACGILGAADKGECVYDEIVRCGLLENDLALGNAVVDMYAKCGALGKAQQALEELRVRDVISWSALIIGYAQQGQGEQALNCYERMQHEGLSPNAVTFSGILKACGSIGAAGKGELIHDEIATHGLLVDDIVIGTALVDMYAKCGALAKAQQLLEELPTQDIAPWNAMISGYAQHGQGEQALKCFEQMQCKGFYPNAVTLVCILKACSIIGLVVDDAHMQFVNMITNYGIKPVLEHYTCVVNALGHAGYLDEAVATTKRMPSFDNSIVVWSALLGTCRKMGDVNIGKWAFKHAMQVDKSSAAAYLLMADIY